MINDVLTVPLRIAFDMDGTLADLSSAYAQVEERLFGSADDEAKHPAPEVREQEQQTADAAAAAQVEVDRREEDRRGSATRIKMTRNRDQVWKTIEATPNFWATLQPLEKDAVKRLYQLTGELNWEVFFITQRPATAGGTVQWQTHKWLMEQGFATPSVIPLSGGRGKAAAALRLDYLIDDTPQNCVDVLSDSSTRAILLVDPGDPLAEGSAKRLGIGVAYNVHQVLDLLTQITEARTNPTLFEKLRKIVGWK
jgi:5'(3')-deoxyribonucleotidase